MSTTNGERYWLLERRGYRGLAADERWVVDHFVCCEVPVEGDAAVALEVFTSRESAEAELRGIERLAAGGGILRSACESGERFVGGELNKAASEEVVELLEPELEDARRLRRCIRAHRPAARRRAYTGEPQDKIRPSIRARAEAALAGGDIQRARLTHLLPRFFDSLKVEARIQGVLSWLAR